jgi:hypothetical protein
MRIRESGGDISSDSARTAIDRQAVIAASQLLMSAIWLEHRARRFSMRLSMLPSQRASVVSAFSTSVAHQKVRGGARSLKSRTTEPPLTTRKV